MLSDNLCLFFLVWCEGGGAPTMRHSDYATASREAKRLARGNPGQRFTVMVAVQGFEVNDLKEVRYLGLDEAIDDRIPF